MWLAAASQDPVRVIVEQSAGGWFASWGPLVGVVVGALLGAIGQAAGAAIVHRRDLDRERREWRRAAYVQLLDAAGQFVESILQTRAMKAIQVDRGHVDPRFRAKVTAASSAAQQALLDSQVRVSLYAPERAQQAIDGLCRALRAVDTERRKDGWDDVTLWHGRVLAEARKDLGVAGSVSLLPPEFRAATTAEAVAPASLPADTAR